MSKKKPLIDRLTEAICAITEWRVQEPKDGSYCMSFSYSDYSDPERAALEWLQDCKNHYPDSRYSGYEVAKVVYMPAKDQLIDEAADRIIALEVWIEIEGKRTNTCTFNILGKVCSDCKCPRKNKK